jgi:hypothetical protein
MSTPPILPTRLKVVDDCTQLLRHFWIIEVIPSVTKNRVPDVCAAVKKVDDRLDAKVANKSSFGTALQS